MAIRRDALDAVGGFEPLADYCADDYVLGRDVAESGRQVVMSQHVIDHVVINRNFSCSMRHQIRWMKSTRFSRRAGHAGTVLTFAMPFGVLGLVAAGALHHWALGVGLFAAAYLNRVVMAVVAGWGVVRDPRALRLAWLYPLARSDGLRVLVRQLFRTRDRMAWRLVSPGRRRAHGAGAAQRGDRRADPGRHRGGTLPTAVAPTDIRESPTYTRRETHLLKMLADCRSACGELIGCVVPLCTRRIPRSNRLTRSSGRW